ncbi:MAG: amidase [Bacteroidales bacterium]
MKKLMFVWLRRVILVALVIGSTSCQMEKGQKAGGPDYGSFLEEMTIDEIRQGYLDDQFTITEVVREYLDRIERINRSGPGLNAIICINPDALEIAAELDRELAEGKVRGPLHGIPVVLKDNIDTGDRMPTTAGATVLGNSFAPADSWVAKKLREAGAVILAKANLSEWANFRSNRSSSGWSGVGGQTKNPYVLDRNPCGSSSGSGVAVSANLCAIAIGTETNGSIVCPSNANGIVGLKPTVGLVSRTGIIPISFSQDTPGPMGRTVRDVAECLGALTGIDPADSKTAGSEGHSYTDYTQFLSDDALQGKRIGLLRDAMGFHQLVDSLMEKTVEHLKSHGAEVVDVQTPRGGGYGGASYTVMLYEFKDGLNRYFASLGEKAPVGSLSELIEFNKQDPVELRHFDQNILIAAEARGGLDSPEYIAALERMYKATRQDGIDRLMDENRLDAIMAPTGSPAWKTDLINGDHFLGGSSSLAAISGYPNITVPMGLAEGLPVGVSFFGRAWSEPVLLGIAYAYEQGTKHRVAPRYLETDLFE